MSRKRDLSKTKTGRPISQCPVEILGLARIGAGLRISEIHVLAKASGEDVVSKQMLAMLEKTAMKKLRLAMGGLSIEDLLPEKPKRVGGRRKASH